MFRPARHRLPSPCPTEGESLFISDLHLRSDQPATLDCFLRFLAGRARAARWLYILGDLFDVWIGDDDDAPLNRVVQSALRALTDSGTECAMLHGNRDFLLGRAFLRATGCRQLPDPCLIQIDGEPTLLMHGDRLCTDDLDYQRFRRRVRHPLVKRLFLWTSLARRRAIAADYRRRSVLANSAKTATIMDVNQQAVIATFRRYGATRLIHGHTHRPADHVHEVDGRAAQRLVLAEWRDGVGEALSHSALGWRRLTIA
ncbi:MAG: UDP-2,3-diacylglucosamine diphosphatase [Thermochromatium sp.]